MEDIIYVDAIGTAETTILSEVGTPWQDEPCNHRWAQSLGNRIAVCMLCGAEKDTAGGD